MLTRLPKPDQFGNYWLATDARSAAAKGNCAAIFPYKYKEKSGTVTQDGWWVSFGNEQTFGQPNGPIFSGHRLRIFNDPQQALRWMLEYVESARQSER